MCFEIATYAELAVVLDSLLIVFLDIIREVVDGNIIVLDVLHDLCKLHEYYD